MKKILLFLICQFFFHTFSAQGWCKPGATWHYKIFNIGPSIGLPFGYWNINGVEKYQYTGDTVLNGINCNIVISTFSGYLNSYSATATVAPNFKRYYTYQNNKVVYAWSPSTGTFDTIVNFNAAVGNKWLRNRLGGTCNKRGVMTVVDTGRVLINNLSLKRVVTTYTNTYTWGNSNNYTVTATDTLIERIMNRNNFMFPMYCEADTPRLDQPTLYTSDFKCYQDNNFALYKKTSTTLCDFDVGFDELSGHNIPLKIYPNPCSGQVTLESDVLIQGDLYTIDLLNVLGQSVRKHEIKPAGRQLVTDLGHLPGGIYYIQLRYKEALLANEKLIRE